MSALVGKHMDESPATRKLKTVGLTHSNAGPSSKTECPINIPAITGKTTQQDGMYGITF